MTKILIVEDEKDILDNLKKILSFEGFETIGASDGILGLEAARREQPDLIVCDIMMPGLDGYQLAAELKKEDSTSVIPFIFLSARADRSDIRRGMESGADDYLTKPFNKSVLLSAINTRLEKSNINRKVSETKLSELRRSITQSMPHEMMTPLSNIIGYSDLILMSGETLSKSEIIDMVGEIKKSGGRLHRLIDNFLLYSELEVSLSDPELKTRITSGKMAGVKDFLYKTIMEKAVSAARESDVQLELNEGELNISLANLKKIMEELLNNAFAYSKRDTPVRVSNYIKDSNFVVRVANEGRGMTPEQLARVGAYIQFERKFYEQQGVGLGLSIVKRITELHGGCFTIESGENMTTAVTVMLPCN